MISNSLSNHLYELSDGCQTNKMHLNVPKFQHIKFTRNHKIIPSVYMIQNTKLFEFHCVQDLGVTLRGKLTSIPYMENILRAAANKLGFVIRNSQISQNLITKIQLYNAFVLWYRSVIWRPHYYKHSFRIERIQKL